MSGGWKVKKQTKDSLAIADEARLRAGAQLAMREQWVRDRLGKKTPKDTRGNEYADTAIFTQIQHALRSGGTVRLTGRKDPGVLIVGARKDKFQGGHSGLHEEQDSDEVTIYVPLWKHTGAKLKTLAWIMSLQGVGDRAVALNLRIGADVLEMAGEAKAKREIGLARFLRDRMTKSLKRNVTPLGLGTPEFFFWVEADRPTTTHLHGVIVIPAGGGAPALRAIRNALKSAGGRWRPDKPEGQLQLRTIFNPAGWADYVTKWHKLTRLRLETNNTVAASSGIRSAASVWYTTARASEKPISNR